MVNATPSAGGGGRFTVDTDAISNHGGSVGNIAREIEGKMGQMQRQLQSLQSQWQGSASNQYASLYNDWERQQRNVKDSLDRIAKALGKAADGYRQVEHTNRTTFTPV